MSVQRIRRLANSEAHRKGVLNMALGANMVVAGNGLAVDQALERGVRWLNQ